MTSTDPSKAFFDFWTNQGQALMRMQDQASKAFAQGLQSMSSGALPFGSKTDSQTPDVATSAAEMGRASKSLADLWSAATALSGSLTQKYPTSDKTVETTFIKMFDPNAWMGGMGEMDDVLGRMAEGPRFADLWEIERLYARVASAWMTLRRNGLEHQAVILKAWMQAGRLFTEELAARKSADAPDQDAKAALALWTTTANRQLVEMQRSDAFLKTQSSMIRATTDLRLAQQALMEHFGKQYGFPTRTELDDVHRTVTELRREMRALRRRQPPTPNLPPSRVPEPTHHSAPEPVHFPAPEPAHRPEPETVHLATPEPEHHPEPEPVHRAVPEPAHHPEPEPSPDEPLTAVASIFEPTHRAEEHRVTPEPTPPATEER